MLTTVTAAVFLGIAAQILAEKLRLPAILPLLILGILSGPTILGIVHPHQLGHGLELLVHLGVAVILFEGGLSLDLGAFAQVSASVRNLLTIGVVATGTGAALLAHYVGGLELSTAVLFGAIMTVTGPTVIAPLLRHMIAPQRFKTILLSEGLIIDPIGAVLAYFVLQWIQRAGMAPQVLFREIILVGLTGTILGFAAGAAGHLVLRKRLVGHDLNNLLLLALLMLAYLLSESQSPQSGILTAVVMGLTLSGSEAPDLVSVRTFKEQLTTLLISMLFILLSAGLSLESMGNLGWKGVAVALGLVFLVRPISVLLSVWPRQLPFKERLALALTAPRGIVAAAVASLAALSLLEVGQPGGEALEGLVYLSIMVTCGWSTLMALFLPKWLGFDQDPSRRRTILVGANALTNVLAKIFRDSGREVVIVDTTPFRLDRFRQQGYTALQGDARDASTFESAGVQRGTIVISATTNDALNLLVAELVHGEFGVEHPVVTLQKPSGDFQVKRRAWAEILGGEPINVPKWIRHLDRGEADILTISPLNQRNLNVIAEAKERWSLSCQPLLAWREDKPLFHPLPSLGEADSLALLVDGNEVKAFLATELESIAELPPSSESIEDGALIPET